MDYEVGSRTRSICCAREPSAHTQKGKSPLDRSTFWQSASNQLKAMVDLCHHYGIAVILGVVYNHASGDVKSQPESILLSRPCRWHGSDNSLYFTNQDHTGPVFAFWNQDVRQFLIDNATYFIEEYHVGSFGTIR